ncbi:MAG TPA: MTH938/NDUFAF3 family protein [Steroidobacteraceae bacterium]|jgi:uncharacterized protein|nr:MTH938/NDUFAF3 family protein [Steroidobacteraceae bacterium]
MRLALDSDPRIHLVRSYGEGSVVIDEQRLTRPLLVSPQRLLTEWPVESFEALSNSEQLEADLAPLLQFGAGIVLLGAGHTQPQSTARLRATFRARQIALECMTLGAACRTYNVLASEQRAVVAGLFPSD